MSHFVSIDSVAGRIGHFCWANSDTRHPPAHPAELERLGS